MITDRNLEIKIHPTNRLIYENLLKKKLKNGELITIPQNLITSGSSTLVEIKCDLCDNLKLRKRNTLKGNKHFCSVICKNEWSKVKPTNPESTVNTQCSVCKKDFTLYKSVFEKSDSHRCSRECYALHRSNTYKGNKIYNYNSLILKCANCDKKIIVSKFSNKRNKRNFCKKECYYQHRRKHYKEFYYSPMINEKRPETYPEKKVRKWLESKNIKFKQEVGFFKKYYADFYLPDYKTILEVNGDYWHANPLIYDILGNDDTKKPLTKQQASKSITEYDTNRKAHFEKYGYTYKVIWEKEIKEDFIAHINQIFYEIRESVTTTR